MSDKNYKGKKGVDGDDYKPLKFYQDKTSGVENGFDKFSDGDEHFFTYSIDGEVVLISEGYASEKGRDNGTASVDKNRLIEARYKRDVYQSENHFFNLVAGNHQEIATSAWFTSAAAMEAAIARLMGNSAAPLAAGSIVGSVAAGMGGALAASASSSAPVAAAAPSPTPIPPQTAYKAPEPEQEEKEGCGCNWLWILLPLLLAALVWYLFSQCCSKPIEAAPVAAAVVAPAVAPAIVEPVAAETNVVDQAVATVQSAASGLGDFFASKLPDGIELNIPKLGVENKLIGFIEDDSKPVDKTTWFEFDRINFDTAKADLTLGSREQIANIAQIMNAYPNVKLKIGGYTDSTGSEAFNQTLSENRADSVKNSLISQGVSQDRIDAEGYGSQFPVASNETEEGRAKNRRIALRVTEK